MLPPVPPEPIVALQLSIKVPLSPPNDLQSMSSMPIFGGEPSKITQLSLKVSSIYDFARQESIVETTTQIIRYTIHSRSRIINTPQQLIINVIDIEQPQPKEQLSPETINISSNSDGEEGVHEDVSEIGLFEKKEQNKKQPCLRD
ncbi:hypothetical protein PIB30_071630 [Stylosanthes scabra]|uniref:Uncharacterized protein n=1 Tax=Stylosanthes scabra TaxID=79078 RepID=A0ABU6SQU7_9FABA|nr:hypothetical protein [Stylosanthes scabra]